MLFVKDNAYENASLALYSSIIICIYIVNCYALVDTLFHYNAQVSIGLVSFMWYSRT